MNSEMTSGFRSIGKTSVNRVRNCGQLRTSDGRDAHAFVRYVMKNRRATLPQVTENVNVVRDQTMPARTH